MELLAFILVVVGAFCGALLLGGLVMFVFTGKFPD
jgi:DNA-binding transcriptional regulator of glucitol operon